MSKQVQRILLLGILAFQLLLGAGYALGTPVWETPDEPAHYNYIRYVAERAELPVLQPGDWNADELERLKAAKFPPSMSVDGVRYEFHQPPLYYVLMAPLYKAVAALPLDQQVVLLRLVSVGIGALVLLVAYAIAQTLFPNDPLLALGVPATMAVIPMHTAMSAAINNDPLAELLLAVILYLCLLRLQDRLETRRYVVLAGLVLGLGMLTKVTVYVGAVLYAAAEVGRGVVKRRAEGAGHDRALLLDGFRSLAATAAVTVAIGAWWFVRNAAVYGNLDILGRQRHDQVVVGQLRTELGWPAVEHFAVVTFKSFWAQFGWMGILVDERIYQTLAVLSGLAGLGCALYLAQRLRHLPIHQKWGLGLLALLFLLIFAGVVQYNLDYVQPQGRYLFPAAVAVAVAFVLGLRQVAGYARVGPLALLAAAATLAYLGVGRAPAGVVAASAVGLAALWRLRPRAVPAAAVAAILVALAALDIYCLVGVIVPYFR